MAKFKQIAPDPADIADFRRKLKTIVSRMQSDYDNYLRPLILRIQDKKQKHEEETKTLLAADAVKFLTPYEVSRHLHILKSQVISDIESNKIQGVVFANGDYLIPEESMLKYGVTIGKIDPQKELMQVFNDRVEALTKKYNDLIYAYESMSRKLVEKMYQRSKKKFLSQFEKNTGVDIMRSLSERGLKEEFEKQVSVNVDLIKSLPSKYFAEIKTMVIQSTTGGLKYEGGLQKAIIDLTGATRERATLIARDQSTKSVSVFNRLRFTNLGSQKYVWRNSKDKRVAGNPNGLYPNVDPNSKFHGNHWVREGKEFDWNKPPKDGHPGEAINCRCWAEPIFDLDE